MALKEVDDVLFRKAETSKADSLYVAEFDAADEIFKMCIDYSRIEMSPEFDPKACQIWGCDQD